MLRDCYRVLTVNLQALTVLHHHSFYLSNPVPVKAFPITPDFLTSTGELLYKNTLFPGMV